MLGYDVRVRRLAILALTLVGGCAQHHDRNDAATTRDASPEASTGPAGVWRGEAQHLCVGGWLFVITRAPAAVCGEVPALPALGLFTSEPELEEGRRYDLLGTWATGLDAGATESAEGYVDVLEWRPGTRVRLAFSYATASGARVEGEATLESFCPSLAVVC